MDEIGSTAELEVDGGIGPDNVAEAVTAGATVVVADKRGPEGLAGRQAAALLAARVCLKRAAPTQLNRSARRLQQTYVSNGLVGQHPSVFATFAGKNRKIQRFGLRRHANETTGQHRIGVFVGHEKHS